MLSLFARRVALQQTRSIVLPTATTSAWRNLSTTAVEESKSPAQLMEQFDSSEVRTELSKLRDAESDLMTQLKATDVTIDWEQWKRDIKYPGLVDELKKEYESGEQHNLEEDQKLMTKELNALFDPIISQYEKMALDAEEDTAHIEKQLEQVEYMRDNIDNMPLDEFFKRYPKIKQSIEKDVVDNKWFIE